MSSEFSCYKAVSRIKMEETSPKLTFWFSLKGFLVVEISFNFYFSYFPNSL